MNKLSSTEPSEQQITSSSHNLYGDEIDLLELWRALWRGRWFISGLTFVFSMASVFYALSLPNMYQSVAVLTPSESASGAGGAKFSGQFGGLASLAGISLTSGGKDQTVEAIEILQSWTFIEELIQELGIAPQVFAVKGWSPETGDLIYDSDIYDSVRKVWTRDPPKGKQSAPSSWELYERFSKYFSVRVDKASGFTYMTVNYYSPNVAKQWADILVNRINTQLQSYDAAKAERNIAFLKQQIEETSLASMHTVLYGLIEEQTKTLMLAKSSVEYVFRTVSKPRIAERKASPRRSSICFAGTVLGAGLGFLLVVINWYRLRLLAK